MVRRDAGIDDRHDDVRRTCDASGPGDVGAHAADVPLTQEVEVVLGGIRCERKGGPRCLRFKFGRILSGQWMFTILADSVDWSGAAQNVRKRWRIRDRDRDAYLGENPRQFSSR